MKQCPKCQGEGFTMIDENPEECERCEGTGEVIDLEYPIYKYHGAGYYKMLPSGKYIQVYLRDNIMGPSAGQYHVRKNWVNIISDGDDITQDVFEEKYFEAKCMLDREALDEPEMTVTHQLSPGLEISY